MGLIGLTLCDFNLISYFIYYLKITFLKRFIFPLIELFLLLNENQTKMFPLKFRFLLSISLNVK